MKAGQYAVVDGVEYVAPPRGTAVFVAHSRDPGPYSDVTQGHPSNLRFEAIDNEWVGYLEVDALPDVREIHHDVSVATYSTPREQRPRR